MSRHCTAIFPLIRLQMVGLVVLTAILWIGRLLSRCCLGVLEEECVCLYLPIASTIFTQREENTVRKIIVSMRVTLDGFIAGPNGEMDWMEEFLDEALANYESELQKMVDTTLFGRVTYEGFESYWPQVALDPASPQGLVEYAHQL